MSYEGYTEFLCQHGHHWAHGCYNEPDKPVCPTCTEPPVWNHMIDQTNGEIELDDGTIDPSTQPWPLEVDHYEARIVYEPIYVVPKRGNL